MLQFGSSSERMALVRYFCEANFMFVKHNLEKQT